MWDELTEQERLRLTALNDEREIDGIEQGVARYRVEVERSDVGIPERRIMVAAIHAVSESIRQDQQQLLSGRARMGRPTTWVASYVTMEPEKLALIAMSCMLGTDDLKLTKIAFSIADRVKLEHEFDEVRRLNERNEKDSKGFTRNIHARLQDRRKVRSIYRHLTKEPLKWTYTHRLGIGSRLIQIVCNASGLWSVETRRVQSKTTTWLAISDELAEAVASGHSDMEIMRPVTYPMCCPPVPWALDGGKIVGGYRIIRNRFVRDKFGEHPVDYSKHDMTSVLSALNSIQNVEWRIDDRILALASYILNRNSSDYDNALQSLPTRPTYPEYSKDFTKEERRVWFQRKNSEKAAWRAKASIRTAQLKAIKCAIACSKTPVFFPCNLDWRSRIYPIPTYLSPQGFDLQKACLRFARAKPLGSNGLRRLKIWAANCAGQDKISFQDRIRWFDSTHPDPRSFDPFEDKAWVEYDSPFLFVQAMLEIKDALSHPGGHARFPSSVSVCVDGSQNGLQHLSALGRDEVGGTAVNLIDSDVPADLYQDVADIVYASVCGDAELLQSGGNVKDEMGQDLPPISWLPHIDTPKKRRSVVKRSVLAYPYGVTKAGMRDGLIVDGFTNDVSGSKHRNAWYLAEKIDEAVRDVVVSAGRLMDWFRTIAEELARKGKPVRWTAPSGFPVSMHYFVKDVRRIRTCLANLSVMVPTNEVDVDVQAQVRGIVANFTHSLDASHLCATANAANSEGIHDLQFVHDSFGTHACDIDRLGVVLRRAFVTMHSTQILQDFAESLGLDEIPQLPEKGSLDLNEVMASRFFFA